MVAHGNSDTLVTSVTTTPAIVEVTRLSATRHWQDNGKTIIRCSGIIMLAIEDFFMGRYLSILELLYCRILVFIYVYINHMKPSPLSILKLRVNFCGIMNLVAILQDKHSRLKFSCNPQEFSPSNYNYYNIDDS